MLHSETQSLKLVRFNTDISASVDSIDKIKMQMPWLEARSKVYFNKGPTTKFMMLQTFCESTKRNLWFLTYCMEQNIGLSIYILIDYDV